MSKTFDTFNLNSEIVKSLETLGFEHATEVQEKVIPKVIEGKDLIVISKTGSGKTGAFGIPILSALQAGTQQAPKALILTPTRELAVQVDQDLKKMSKFKPIKATVIYGGHKMGIETDKLAAGVDVVTGTPGRVYDHISQGNLITKEIKYLVLDEADRMLDMGFIDQVNRIIKKLPQDRITLLFSATIPSEIQRLCKTYMRSPETIEIESDTKTVDTITQYYHRVENNEKRRQLHRILTVEQPESCMVFCNTRIAVDRVNEFLTHKGYATKALHGANSQSNRMRSIQQFKKGDLEVLVATDVAARGIHVEELSMVINYDVPQDKDSYVHRIGRTGRAGNGGKAITLVTKDDLYSLYEIEEHVGVLIEEKPLPTDEQVSAMPKRMLVPKVDKAPVERKSQNPKQSNKGPSKRGDGNEAHKSKPHQTKSHPNKPHHSKPPISKQPHETVHREPNTVHREPNTVHREPNKVEPSTPESVYNTPSAIELQIITENSIKKPLLKRLVDKILKK